MTVVSLDPDVTQALKTLAAPLVTPESWAKKLWTWIVKTKFVLVLYLDILAHIYAIFFLKENWFEGTVTLVSFFLCNIFTVSLVRNGVAESTSWNTFFMFIGLYDLKRYLDRPTTDRQHRENVKPYLDGEKLLHLRTLESIHSWMASKVLDATVNFRREIIGTLPLLVIKVYFVVADPSRCSIVSIIRIFVILFGFYETVKVSLVQEWSTIKYLKTGLLVDIGLELECHRVAVNLDMPTRMTRLFDLLAMSTSMVYRIYGCVFYTLINPFVGACQLIFALLLCTIHHLHMRPVYENPPIGVATLTYDIVEVVAKLFFVRNNRLYKSIPRIRTGRCVAWTFVAGLEFLASLYFIHLTNIGREGVVAAAVGTANGSLPFCPGWISDGVEFFSDALSPNKFLTGSGNLVFILLNSWVLTSLLLLSLVVNGAHLIYLGKVNENEAHFPVVVACEFWIERFFARVVNWERAGTNETEWLKRMLVLTLLSPSDYRKYILGGGNGPVWKSNIGWNNLVFKLEGAMPPPGFPEVLVQVREEIMSRSLGEFITKVYFIDAGEETGTIRKLAYLMSIRFDHYMTNMDSRRIFHTCRLLGVHPFRKSPSPVQSKRAS